MKNLKIDPFMVAVIFHLLFCLVLLWASFVYDEPLPVQEPRMVEFTLATVKTPADEKPPAPSAEPAASPLTPPEDEATINALAQLVYGEARGCSITEQAAVVWCVLNRVDAGYGDIMAVATAPNQFVGYRPGNPIEAHTAHLVRDVLLRWHAEKTHGEDAGRVLPEDYLWFHGDGKHNHFRNEYEGGDRWDWSLPSPYEEILHGD